MRTNTKRLWPVMAFALILAFLLTGCGGGESVATSTVSFVERVMPQIGLPRITVRYDETGVPKVFGVKLSTISRLLPIDLSFANLSSDMLSKLAESNIQHIELDINEAGLFIFVNGKGLPYLAWNEERLKAIGSLIDQTDAVPFDATIAKAMPLLGRIGIDVVLVFPPPPGQAEIPIRDRKERFLVEAPAVEEPTATIQATIEYSEDGVPAIAGLGITSREIAQVANTDLSSVELTPDRMTLINAAGLQNLAIVTAPDGLHLLVNEQDLIHLAYDAQHLSNVAELYAAFAGDESAQEIATLIQNLAPILEGADVDLVVKFPAGQ